MNENNFPSWAPKKVIMEWEEKLSDAEYWHERFPQLEPDTSEADAIYRLLTYEDMKTVWQKLPKYNVKPSLFSSMVQLSSLYIQWKPHNLTPKEYKEWLVDVKETALKLKGLVELSDYDSFLSQKYLVKRNKHMMSSMVRNAAKLIRPGIDVEDHLNSEPEYKRWPDLNPGLLSRNLAELAALKSDQEIGILSVKGKTSSVHLDKPNHPNAKRSYFIKKLTQLLRESTGKPLREIVTITTATYFDDPSITERQVVRTAP